MAQIVQEPQLRYTPDQTALAEMLVQFPGPRAEDPPATLKVVGWGNLAQEIQQNHHQGDRVIIEGRLSMSTVERKEGFKEKRAELTVQRIHSLGADASFGTSATVSSDTGNDNSSLGSVESRTPVAATASNAGVINDFATDVPAPQSTKPQSPTYPVLPSEEKDIDDIPF